MLPFGESDEGYMGIFCSISVIFFLSLKKHYTEKQINEIVQSS